jgi:TonB family protein
MAKVVKYCAVCEEGFAEKFGFCPNCGASLTAYEMNPLAAEKSSVDTVSNVEEKISSPIEKVSAPIVEKTNEPAMETFSADEDELLDIQELPDQTATYAPASVSSNYQNYSDDDDDSSSVYQNPVSNNPVQYGDSGYHVTFVEEQNGSNRNLLLFGAFLMVTVVSLGMIVFSLFNTTALVGSLNENELLSFVNVDDQPNIEELDPPKKDGKKGGGGGGGGKQEEEVRKGDLASQMKDPKTPPTTHPIEGTTPIPPPAFQAPDDIKRDKPVGSLLGTKLTGGDGPGTGGGIGTGNGRGQGSGIGTGAGSGRGSGIGDGDGNGYGNGTGDGRGGDDGPPKLAPKGPTVGVSILSKPRPSYTDEARQKQVTGVVRLKVTFLASGQIGSVAPVSGLPYGLTEQAIASAKQIRFEPAKVNGVPQTVSKTIEYSFSIY